MTSTSAAQADSATRPAGSSTGFDLSPPDAALYSVLARATLEVARARGLDPDAAARVEQLLPEAE